MKARGTACGSLKQCANCDQQREMDGMIPLSLEKGLSCHISVRLNHHFTTDYWKKIVRTADQIGT